MNKLGLILKSTIINNWGLNGFSGKVSGSKEKKKALMTAITLLIGAFSMTYIVSVYGLLLADSLEKVGFLYFIIIMAIFISTIATLFTSIYKAQGSLFASKDYDLLMAMPIKPWTILTAKLIDLLLLNWLFTAFAILPISVIYFVRMGNLSPVFFAYAIGSIIFIPLIPTIVASIIAILISYFASKFKYTNIITIVFTILVFVGFMVSSMKMNKVIEYILTNSSSIMDGIGKIYPPVIYLTNALVENSFIEFLKFIVISIVPFVIFIFIFSKLYTSINNKLAEKFSKGNYKVTTLKTNSVSKTLIKKEFIRYFSTPIYVLNTAIGMVMALMAAVATFFIDRQTLAAVMNIPYVEGVFPLMILVLMIFCIGLSSTTNSSISLEGKNLWIMKTLPLSEIDVFKGKIAVSLIITMPATLIVNILFYVGLKYELQYLLWNLVITLLYALFASLLGIVVNLYLPKLDWTTPTAVVKQSASVLVSLMVIMASVGIPIGLFIILKITNINMFLTTITIILGILVVTLYRLLVTVGVKKYRSL